MKRKEGEHFLKYFSILLILGIVLFLTFNIELNPTGNVIESQTSLANVTTSYIYGNGLAASYDSDGNEKYYINDHLGGTSIVLDENGNKISEESYYAFGEEKTSGDSRFTYTGKEKDSSGLYYYGARYYDSDSGRFTQPDPISGNLQNPQSLNKYVYVTNNPMKYVDPSGMQVGGPNVLSPHEIIDNLGDPPDIMQFAKYVANGNPEEGLQIITSDSLKVAGVTLTGELKKTYDAIAENFVELRYVPGESFHASMSQKTSFPLALEGLPLGMKFEVEVGPETDISYFEGNSGGLLMRMNQGSFKVNAANFMGGLGKGAGKFFGALRLGGKISSVPPVHTAKYVFSVSFGDYWQGFKIKEGKLASIGEIKDAASKDVKYEKMNEKQQKEYDGLVRQMNEDFEKQKNNK